MQTNADRNGYLHFIKIHLKGGVTYFMENQCKSAQISVQMHFLYKV